VAPEDQFYEVGDTVKGFTITGISQSGVEFRKNKKAVFKEVTSYR
jgi:hypothetical protein